MTVEPLRDAGCFVHSRLRSFYPNGAMKDALVMNSTKRTKWGFYLCQALFKIPDGVEFVGDDMVKLQMFCALEGQPKPILFPYSCCEKRSRLVDDCVNANWSGQDGVGAELGFTRSPDELLEELAESIFTVLGTTCYGKQMSVIRNGV